MTSRINIWVARLFDPTHLDRTVHALADANELVHGIASKAQEFERRIAAARSSMERLQRAIEAGWDPEALTEQYNAAVAERRAAEAGLAAIKPAPRLSAGDIRAMVSRLGGVAKALDQASRNDLSQLYDALGLAVAYDHRTPAAEVSITPALRGLARVRGGTRTLTTRLDLSARTFIGLPG